VARAGLNHCAALGARRKPRGVHPCTSRSGPTLRPPALKAADGLKVPVPSLLALVGYGAAFFFLSQAVRTLPVGVANALWSRLERNRGCGGRIRHSSTGVIAAEHFRAVAHLRRNNAFAFRDCRRSRLSGNATARRNCRTGFEAS
jgi:hypothetical protein